MNTPKISRRTILRGVGTAMALPWLEAMSTPSPLIANVARRAVSNRPPVRMAFLYVPNGMHMPDWKPFGPEETGFELPKILEPMAEVRDQMNIITGCSLRNADAMGAGGGDHARSVSAFLTGARARKTHGSDIRNGVSVDQVAAAQLGRETRLRSLELGTEDGKASGNCDTGYSCLYTSNISWRTPTSPLPKEVDPAAVFTRLFGAADGASRHALAKRESDRQSVLDFVLADAKRLHRDLGVMDRRKLDEYLYAVRDIERRLQTSDKLEQSNHDASNFQRPVGIPADYGQHVTLMLDMLAIALQTDTTRVCSFMFANAASNRSYRNLSISEGHHTISHHGKVHAKQQQISKINVYHAGLAAHLIKRLASTPEGDGSLLDNCMVLYGSGISDGNVHSHHDLPITLFGKAGGSIKTGRHIRVRSKTPLTNLYCSMLEHAGVHVESFSDSNGVVDELKG